MALYEGFSADTTEKLAGKWCGDLLQIVDDLPKGYRIIDCCFAHYVNRANYYQQIYGVNNNGYVFKDNEGELFGATTWFSYWGFRNRDTYNVKVGETGKKYILVPKNEIIGEHNKALAIAQKLLQKGMTLEEVSDATGLTQEEIKEFVTNITKL